jgi:hypothetical protein
MDRGRAEPGAEEEENGEGGEDAKTEGGEAKTEAKTEVKTEEDENGDEVRSVHWSPYDRVGVVNADP